MGSIHLLVQNVVLLNSVYHSSLRRYGFLPSPCRFSTDTFSCRIPLFPTKLTHITSLLHRASQTQLSLIPSVMYYIPLLSPAPRHPAALSLSISSLLRPLKSPPPSPTPLSAVFFPHKPRFQDVARCRHVLFSHEHILQVDTVA